MRDDDKPNLRRLPLFREMMTPTFDSLMQIAYSQTFPPQLELIRQGEYADFLHIIIEGSVELRATWNGRDTVMGVVHASPKPWLMISYNIPSCSRKFAR